MNYKTKKITLIGLLAAVVLISGSWVKNSPIIGRWVSKEDRRYIVIFKKDKFIELYGKDTTSVNNYTIGKTSCDSSYFVNDGKLKVDFLHISDGRCFEITGLTATSLSYGYTKSGKVLIFQKVK